MIYSDSTIELLERSEDLALLDEALARTIASSRGRLVVLAGEAGAGKTVLLRQFCTQLEGSARVLWGACDRLFTPRPLGPLLDVADTVGGRLEEVAQSDARPHQVATELMVELRENNPTVLVLEDLQWADEATLDVLRLLARRIDAIPAVVLVSYRDDELGRTHPLRMLLGELATDRAAGRLKLKPLSADAVAKLSESHNVDALELHRKTGGNPFFVTEALAAGDAQIPETVRDAVLARAARLNPAARGLLEAVAVMPPQTHLAVLEAVAGRAVDRLDECLSSGMLMPVAGGISFRHELARLAVEESITPDVLRTLHKKTLTALAAEPGGPSDLARLAHHAEGAGEEAAVLQFAPAAGERAAALGAHREAAAQYARALRFVAHLSAEQAADLLERFSYESYLTGRFDEAIEAQERALRFRREVGDPLREGDSLRSLSRLLRFVGRTVEAAEVGQEAVERLDGLPVGHELAMAYNNLAHISVTAEDLEGTILWGTRALELAQRLDDTQALVYALTNIGAIEFLTGNPEGVEKLERSAALAREAGLAELSGERS